MSVFKQDFEAWSTTARLKAAFAFPDPADELLVHMLLWAKGDLAEAGPASMAFASTSEDPDTIEVYGGGKVEAVAAGIRFNAHLPLAGFIRDDHIGASCPPMIGIFRRAIKPGQVEALASTFHVVCDIWHSTVPGILAATVSQDPFDENYVHDVRIFADKASYAAHVNKANTELTKAMEMWFDNYDISIPHQGAMYAEDTSDPSMRSSSVKDKPVKVAFNQFHYGRGGMVGKAPVLE
jgi:hypothetical protein